MLRKHLPLKVKNRPPEVSNCYLSLMPPQAHENYFNNLGPSN